MTRNPVTPDPTESAPGPEDGLHLFVDGGFDPGAGQGGWAFVVVRDGVEIASACGGVADVANNGMELIALLKAVLWINGHAAGEPAVIWSDSVHAVKGCNDWRAIWKNNGWKKRAPNGKGRSRTIANCDLWQAIDAQLAENPQLTIAWCKGHAGISGNERADQLAETGRVSRRGRA